MITSSLGSVLDLFARPQRAFLQQLRMMIESLRDALQVGGDELLLVGHAWNLSLSR
jgi:hypothetical protein